MALSHYNSIEAEAREAVGRENEWAQLKILWDQKSSILGRLEQDKAEHAILKLTTLFDSIFGQSVEVNPRSVSSTCVSGLRQRHPPPASFMLG